MSHFTMNTYLNMTSSLRNPLFEARDQISTEILDLPQKDCPIWNKIVQFGIRFSFVHSKDNLVATETSERFKLSVKILLTVFGSFSA